VVVIAQSLLEARLRDGGREIKFRALRLGHLRVDTISMRNFVQWPRESVQSPLEVAILERTEYVDHSRLCHGRQLRP
jgi:hypothetical protein